MTGDTKPVTLETGYVLRVPPFIEEGGKKMLRNLLYVVMLLFVLSPLLSAETFDFMKLSDEVSFYANTSDKFDTRGRTLQIVAINQVKIGAWFQVEFTGDFNWDLTPGYDYDYYIEIGVVKTFWKNLR